MLSEDPWVRRAWNATRALLILWLLLLIYQLAHRVPFPWDVFIWAESPFLTDMVKIENGLGPYTSPADANSFVYSPGLLYLTHALLSPFGKQLDIAWCRLVIVLVGALAGMIAGVTMFRAARRIGGTDIGRLDRLACAMVAVLVIFSNYTADVPHPDSLSTLLSVSVLALTVLTVEARDFRIGMATVVLAGLGCLAKQTGAVLVLGPLVAFILLLTFPTRRFALLAVTGVTMVGLSLFVLWTPVMAKFYTFELLSKHKLYPEKLRDLVAYLTSPWWVIVGFAAYDLFARGGAGRRYVVCWAAVGFFAAVPGLASFFKVFGRYNNLVVFRLWLVMLAWPYMLMLVREAAAFSADGGLLEPRRVRRVLAVVTLGLVASLLPTKLMPGPEIEGFCRKVQELVDQDVRAGKEVLVSHGTAFLVRAGYRGIQRDRANSVLEMVAMDTFPPATRERFATRHYDRIYLITGEWYGWAVNGTLREHYQTVERIPGPPPHYEFWDGAWQSIIAGGCEVLEPKPAPVAPPP